MTSFARHWQLKLGPTAQKAGDAAGNKVSLHNHDELGV